MKLWLVYLHVLSAFGFLLVHGASAAVMFRLQRERDRARLHALLDLSESVGLPMFVTSLLLLVTGIVLGFVGHYWRTGWIWTALGVFVAISLVMGSLGRVYFERVRRAVGIPTYDDKKKGTQPSPASVEEQATVLASGRPMLLTLIGVGGWVIILWLMMFKPF